MATKKLNTQGITVHRPLVQFIGLNGRVISERYQTLRRVGNEVAVKRRNKLLPVKAISKGKVAVDINAEPLATIKDGETAQKIAPVVTREAMGGTPAGTKAKPKAAKGKAKKTATKKANSLNDMAQQLVAAAESGDQAAFAATFTSIINTMPKK